MSSRVIVLGVRPGHVAADIAVDFPRPRLRNTLIGSKAFADLRGRFLSELDLAVSRQLQDDLWNKRDARIRISEHAEATYGATLCGRCMAFCTAGHDAMNRRMKAGQTSYQDDNVLQRDGHLSIPDRIKKMRKNKE